jgi:hypothetical protein
MKTVHQQFTTPTSTIMLEMQVERFKTGVKIHSRS